MLSQGGRRVAFWVSMLAVLATVGTVAGQATTASAATGSGNGTIAGGAMKSVVIQFSSLPPGAPCSAVPHRWERSVRAS